MKTPMMAGAAEQGAKPPVLYDRYLLFAAIAILALGLLMVASASIVISNRVFGQSFHYLYRQAAYIALGVIIAIVVVRIPISFWQRISSSLLIASLVMLTLVLVPGIGHKVNGSIRWIGIGPIGLQVSEFAKLAVIIYLAGYIVRRTIEIKTHVSGFIKPMVLLGLICLLLLREPDFGASAVIMATSLSMLFLAGVRMWHFLVLFGLVLLALAILAISSPYRLERLTTFLNPWANQFDSGYQLTQSLIAFGRGGWSGVGLGESVQKLFYLPEAHTDFLFAVLAEELGLVGILFVFGVFILLIGRALYIGRRAYQSHKIFTAFLTYGLGLWLALQVMINIGVNAGVLPTKGLTLPLMSSGGSSMLVNCMVIALLLRADYEVRMAELGFGYEEYLQQQPVMKRVNFYKI